MFLTPWKFFAPPPGKKSTDARESILQDWLLLLHDKIIFCQISDRECFFQHKFRILVLKLPINGNEVTKQVSIEWLTRFFVICSTF
jgi:hypothetical protein